MMTQRSKVPHVETAKEHHVAAPELQVTVSESRNRSGALTLALPAGFRITRREPAGQRRTRDQSQISPVHPHVSVATDCWADDGGADELAETPAVLRAAIWLASLDRVDTTSAIRIQPKTISIPGDFHDE